MNRRTLLKHIGTYASLNIASGALAGMAAPSPEVFFNQLGFPSQAVKTATVRVTKQPGALDAFRVCAAPSGKVVFEGKLTPGQLDQASGDLVRQANFTAVTKPGNYRIEIGSSLSAAFPIASDVYAAALRLAMRSYYGQRCGCAVDLGNGYNHAACHAHGAYHESSGRRGTVVNHGGWHDAGDYGRYVVNSGISTGTLLWAWELYPQVLRRLTLHIPESGGKLPDYLAEIRWNLEWMLTMQDEDGGVWHKQTSEQFCGFVMPEQDQLTSYVIGVGEAPYKSTCATADLASVAAIAARCYHEYDQDFAARCLMSARRAWTWAMAHPDVPFSNPEHVGTGGYGDAHCSDELLWASAELWRTTGEPGYERVLLESIKPTADLGIEAPSWGDVASMAYWTYALAERPGNSQVKAQIRASTANTAEKLVARAQSNGYGNTMARADYTWGSNAVAANQSLLLFLADRFAPNGSTRQAALGNLHYLVGRNCLGISWITQVGTRPFEHPHHRPSAADGIAAPWPGLLSGGPNVGRGDQVARSLPALPPMRMWVDDERAYSLNEVAINWNAPLVFLLTAANSQSS